MIFKVSKDKKIHLINLKGKENVEELKKSISQAFKLSQGSFQMSYTDEDGDLITLSDEQDFAILTSLGLKNMKITVEEIKEDIKNEQVSQAAQVDQQPKVEPIPVQPIQSIEELKAEELKQEETIFELDDSIIQEKFKKLLPSLISRVKNQIEEEQSERSRIHDKNQPLIIQESQIKPKAEKSEMKEEPKPKMQEGPKVEIHKGVTCDGCKKHNIEGIRYKCAVCADFDYCEKCEATVEHAHPFLKIRTVKQTPIKIIAVLKDENNNFEVNGHKISEEGVQNLVSQGANLLTKFFGNRQGMFPGNRSCPYFNLGRCGKKPQETEKQEEKKMEEKPQEVYVPTVAEKERAAKVEVQEENLLQNARYLSEMGFEFDKCYKFVQNYPNLTKEQLLDSCLSSPEFLN